METVRAMKWMLGLAVFLILSGCGQQLSEFPEDLSLSRDLSVDVTSDLAAQTPYDLASEVDGAIADSLTVTDGGAP